MTQVSPVVVIPTYDNERTVAQVVREAQASGLPVIVVDDGSHDQSGARAREAGATVVAHPVNRGKGAALKTGFAAARERGFTHAVTLDADGQHAASEIPQLLLRARAEPSALVVGQRDFSLMPGRNRFGNRFSNFWVNLAMIGRTKPLTDTQCGFRVYPLAGPAVTALRGDGYELETEVLIRQARGRLPIITLPTSVTYPAERVSHFRARRDATRIVLTVSRFLFLPRVWW